jgi:predicted dehydrogenase
MTQLTRRDFARNVAVAGVGTALGGLRVLGANDRIRVGFIGLGNRGDQVLDGFLKQPDSEIVAICDLHQPYLDFAGKKIGRNPKQFKDYRKVLDLKDVDAVVVATPDHWHALQTIQAYQAGKDVYVEKPLSLCVAEGRKMVEAAKKYSRVTQVGIMRRSSPQCKEAADLIRSGELGKITVIRSFHIQNEWPKGIGNPPDEDPPTDFSWEDWLGPAPKVRYNRNRAFYRFRWFYGYSGGQVTNYGAHYLDFAHWALGQHAPLAVTVMGTKLAVEDNREIPDTLEALWTYPGGTLVTFSQFNTTDAPADLRHSTMEVRGTKGTLYLTWNGFEIVPENLTDKVFPALSPLDRSLSRDYESGREPVIKARKSEGEDPTALHARNFLDCVRSREKCNCDIEIGHRSTSTTLIANIAHQTKSYLEWDAKAERFTNNPAANKHLSYEYRAPYKLPEI